MKKYICRIQVKAEPMTMGDAYNKGLFPVGLCIEEEDKDNEGYLVKEDDLSMWYDKKTFDKYYQCCDTVLDRLMIEQEELSDKLQKLRQFIESPKFEEVVKDNYQRLLLVKQENYMHEYLDILKIRIRLLQQENNK